MEERDTGETIVGTVQGDIAKAYEQSLFEDHPLLGPMHAQFAVRRVTRRGGAPRLPSVRVSSGGPLQGGVLSVPRLL